MGLALFFAHAGPVGHKKYYSANILSFLKNGTTIA
jgi:hypothetical protein